MTDETVPDPSMEDILASIRRILNDGESDTGAEDEAAPEMIADPEPTHTYSAPTPDPDDVLILDPDMMISEASEMKTDMTDHSLNTPVPGDELLAGDSANAASQSVGSLLKALNSRATQVSRNGPTLEDLVREEIRPIAKEWLNAHLPPIVERLVRAEIERVVARAVG